MFLNHETQNWLCLLAFMFYQCFRIQRLTWVWLMISWCLTPLLGDNLNLTSVFLTKLKKDCTSPERYKQAFLEITSQHQNCVKIFSGGSKVHEKVAAAAVSPVAPNSPFSCWLREHCSIYTVELQATLFVLKQAWQSQESKFMIFLRFIIRFTSDRKIKNWSSSAKTTPRYVA